MKKRAVKGSPEEQKGFVWYSLRASFLLMILFLIISLSFPLFLTSLINILFLILLIFAIIMSIIHLFKHKRKAFAITVLIISALLLLFYLIGITAMLNK